MTRMIPRRQALQGMGAAGVGAVMGNRRLYISRGVGHLLRVRFNARPEIPIFQLRRAVYPTFAALMSAVLIPAKQNSSGHIVAKLFTSEQTGFSGGA